MPVRSGVRGTAARVLVSRTVACGFTAISTLAPAIAGGQASGVGMVAASVGAAAPFLEVTARTGPSFVHRSGAQGSLHLPEIMGPGCALLDYDGDGDLDAVLVQGGRLGARGEPGPGPEGHRLFRNELRPSGGGGGELRFVDVTAEVGLDVRGYGMGVAAADFDNDGWTDLFFAHYGTDRLLRNDRGRRFVDVTERLGPSQPGWSVGATFFDYDGDGWLDLYIVRYVEYRPVPCFLGSTRRDYCGPKAFRPLPDRLLRNTEGSFEDVTARVLERFRPAPGLGVLSADLNDDGAPDLYVANDGAENALWLNQGGRAFRDEALLAGVAVNRSGMPEASMGVDAEDVDGNGHLDLIATHLTGETNTFYAGRGGGLFEDQSVGSGLGLPSLPFTGFGTAFLDYDNDGWLDLAAVNGAVRFPEDAFSGEGGPPPLAQPRQLFRNLGNGRFEQVAGGEAFARRAMGRGLARGDVDEDGDVDLLVANTDGPAELLLNQAGQDAPWAGVRLLERGRDALGALAVLVREGAPALRRRAHTDGSYASARDPRVVFGLGGGASLRHLEVRWADGTVERFPPPEQGRYTVVQRGSGTAASP